ncbi:copper transporter [Corynebacterium comes]|uniref:Copper transporter MctB n=1 Tax=Corynebacterium comes TaxID=2675218 RepID=A0A6B8VT59_9CORY|nr:copper transporter [Corynebacterium comes]QGU04524.1 Copper transporter MctB precursor [Corynebacterium comes]
MARGSGKAGWLVGGLGFGVAAGVLLGTLVIAPNMPEGSGPSAGVPQQDLEAANVRADIAEAQMASADSVVGELATSAVEGTLADRPILVIRTVDAVEEDVAGVEKLLSDAAAIDAGTITLGEEFFTSAGADQLKSIVANTLPAGARLSEDRLDPGLHAGEALGSALTLDPGTGEQRATSDERALLLRALRDAGYLDYEDGTILPAQVIVVVTGDSDGGGEAGLAARNLADFVSALDGSGNGAVLAGRIRTAADTGAVGLVRANPENGVSTIDSVDRAVGKMATVLSVREQLAGETGAYGSAESAEAASPAP